MKKFVQIPSLGNRIFKLIKIEDNSCIIEFDRNIYKEINLEEIERILTSPLD